MKIYRLKNYFLLAFLAFSFSTLATVHTVTNTNDNGSNSLRELINNAGFQDTIMFSSSIDGSTIALTTGEITVTNSELTIIGNGPNNTIISGSDNSRIFKIDVNSDSFILKDVKLTNGFANGAGNNGAGGAIFFNGANSTLSNVHFKLNNAHNSGAVHYYQTIGLIRNCIFVENHADFSGGAIGLPSSSVTIFNSLIANNSAENTGGSGEAGGISSVNSNGLSIINTTVANNYCVLAGPGINGDFDASNSIVWGNFIATGSSYNQINGSVTSNYSLIQGVLLSGNGNIDGSTPGLTPNFKNPIPPAAIPNGAGNYRLKCNSVAIDAGENSPLSEDLDGNPRTVDGSGDGTPVIDMGAFENQYTGPEFSQNNYEYCINNGSVQLSNLVSLPNGVFTGPGVQNNHFYPLVAGLGNHEIVYSLSNSKGCVRKDTTEITVLSRPIIQLAVTNATCAGGDGAVDATITTPNSYTVYWSTGSSNEDLQDLNPGVYYITATDGNGCQATKMANVSSDAFTLSSTITDVSCHGGSDGNIDITINGSTGPYTVEWLNNGSNAEDATDIVAGTWEVYVEDANGCVVTEVYEVGEPDDITWTETVIEASCGNNDGSAECLVTGGTAPYSFQWFDASGSQIGGNNNTLASISAGEYFVIITDDNGCTKIWNTVVTETGGPQVTLDTVIHASCANDGSIDISINSANPITSTTWNTGQTSEDLSILSPGYYAVEVIDNAGCTGMLGVDVENSSPATPEICLVTVDTNTITNQVVWEKPTTTSISHYNIYRETSTAGQYQFVDSVLYADESWFTDTVAYPHIRSWRYKISAVNTCGVESDKSPSHKTIHVTKNLALGGGINVSWDEYEGFTYPTYFVHRHTDINGWETIASLSSASSTSYNDNPPSTNELDYFISIEPPSTCVSEKATSHNASRSNRSQGGNVAGPNGGGNTDGLNVEDMEVAQLTVFPNPTSGVVNVSWSQSNGKALYQIFDASGKMISEWESNKQFEIINLERYENGIYFINLQSDQLKNQYRIVKQ